MWTPEYLAGLFDGEGYAGIGFINNPSLSVVMYLGFSVDLRFAHDIVNHMLVTGVHCSAYEKHNPLGQQIVVIIHKAGIRPFIEMILPYVVFKRRSLEILLEALNLKETIGYGRCGKHHNKFSAFRDELHSLAKKGPRTLKIYPQPKINALRA